MWFGLSAVLGSIAAGAAPGGPTERALSLGLNLAVNTVASGLAYALLGYRPAHLRGLAGRGT